MQAAYGVNLISFGAVHGTGQGQTIGIVDAYNDPDIIADAQSFSTHFGLPQFNGNGEPTLQVLNEFGQTSLPNNSPAPGLWDVEEALDVEWAHAIAPQASIILFEANSSGWNDLSQANQTAAATAGVSVVANSWGAEQELPSETAYDSSFLTPAGHQGVTFLASAGDSGAPAGYPAVSPNVIAVGGTTLNVDSIGDYLSESAWTNGGGGISLYEPQPAYQAGKVNGTNATQRTAPDISMDADPATPVDVLDTFDSPSYIEVSGTSLSCTMMAGLIAIANQGRVLNGLTTLDGESQTLPALYDLPSSDFHDITTGNNGRPAGPGYDLATGLGTPVANNLVAGAGGIPIHRHVSGLDHDLWKQLLHVFPRFDQRRRSCRDRQLQLALAFRGGRHTHARIDDGSHVRLGRGRLLVDDGDRDANQPERGSQRLGLHANRRSSFRSQSAR